MKQVIVNRRGGRKPVEAFVPWKRKTLQKDHAENVEGAEEETTGNRKKRMSTV